jgi:hypothetical protein
MAQIGRKIYYDKATGNPILDTGERWGAVTETSVDEDFATYAVLQERVRDTVDYIQLEYGQYADDFAQCNGYKVDVATKTIVFSYPDTAQPEQPPVYQKPLTEQVADLKEQNAQIMLQLAQLGGGA